MARHNDDAVWEFFAGLGGLLFVMLVGSLFRGFVLAKMWLWFIVPFGVVELSVVHAIGLSLIVSFLTFQQGAEKKQEERASFGEKLAAAFIAGNLYTAVVWGLGALVHAFM